MPAFPAITPQQQRDRNMNPILVKALLAAAIAALGTIAAEVTKD
ncbi:MAG: hypothetical protein QM599_03955 [Pseudoxanthomonas sp.]